jgi:hypothetical protein
MGEGLGDGLAEGLGDGLAEGLGEGLGDGLAEGLGEGLGDGLAEGLGEGLTEGLGEGLEEGNGLGDGWTSPRWDRFCFANASRELARVEDEVEIEEGWRSGSRLDVLLVGVLIGVGFLMATEPGV